LVRFIWRRARAGGTGRNRAGGEWLERSYIGAAVHIDATFFNTGTGDLNDDVGGHIAQGFGTDFRRIE